jgi:hypothetical protein
MSRSCDLLVLLVIFFLCGSVLAESCRIECEDSASIGKWALSQHKDAGQGQYLTASSKDDNNLELIIDLSKDAEYYVWVRNFSRGENYRKVKLEINGIPCPDSFGDEPLPPGITNTLVFSRSAAPLKFQKGKNKIKIIPLSPYSRCDLLILSDDKDFKPPEQRGEIEKIPKLNISAAKAVGRKVKDAKQLSVLLFHGGRPWTGQETAGMLKKAGIKVKLIGSAGLDGLGGASLKVFLTDKVEPKAQDHITSEFGHLADYDAVIVCCMEADAQKKFFTPDRIAKLKEFINGGGTLLTAENVPSEVEEILPVKFKKEALSVSPDSMECIPESPVFKSLPAKWPCFSIKNRNLQLKDGAESLVTQIDSSGKFKMPYIASLDMGKGKTIYWNAEWMGRNSCVRLKDWAYFSSVLSSLVYYGSSKSSPDLVSGLRFKQPGIEKLDVATVRLAPPSFSENEKSGIKEVLETDRLITITFGNAAVVKFDKSTCSYSLFYPGLVSPLCRNVAVPEIVTMLDDVHKKLDMSTYEAVVDGKLINKILGLKCDFAGLRKDDVRGSVEIKLTGSSGFVGSLQFKAGKLDINGRVYNGIATGFSIEKMGLEFEAVRFSSSAAMGESADGHYAWRMACYAPPRGFAEVRFGEKLKASTDKWQHFGTGQPFNWLVSKRGVLCEFLDSPFAVTSSISSGDGPYVTVSEEFAIGRVSAPVKLPFIWHYFSSGEPTSPNEWMAVYQFLRQRYCQQAGIKQSVLYPESVHTNTCSWNEKIKSIETARKLGFRIHKIPMCPSDIEGLSTENAAKEFEIINSRGLQAKPWTAGGYTQGMDNEIAAGHPDWLVYGHDGEVVQYFSSHPVFDINNPEYMAHYTSVLDKAIANGMKHIYVDMGGAQTSIINYKGKDKGTQIGSAIKLFKRLNDKGVSVSIEGMSPLCIDEFWFRKGLYVNHTGKEFAFVGMSPSAIMPDYLAMDYFRLAMNYCFIDVVVSPYACGLETVPGENALMEEIGKLNPAITEAIDTLGVPFVQQTPFGTVWISDKGAAIFFWNPVDKLLLEMPVEWKISKVFTPDGTKIKTDSKAMYGIPHKSIVLIKPGK